ncbi:MAG: ABC transporter ATP-binding protein/permease [Firmicutes bacterium]|jgi:subfamily B ATP-binding cassette protein MsbA|nr:ABC transporter ATP-binding protein/permease [Bacillota bacterium]
MRKRPVLADLLRPHTGTISAVVGCMTASALASLALPQAFRILLDSVLSGAGSRANRLGLLNLLVGSVAFVYAAKGILAYCQAYLTAAIGQRVGADLRSRVFDNLQRMPMSFYAGTSAGDTVARVTSDVSAVQVSVTQGAGELFTGALTLAGIMSITMLQNWRLALFSFLMLPALGVAVSRVGARMRAAARIMQSKMAEIASVVAESIAGLETVRAFNLEGRETARFAEANTRSYAAGIRAARTTAALGPVVELIGVAGFASVIWVGGREVLGGRLSPGQLVTFLTYVGMAAVPATSMSRAYSVLQQGQGALDRLETLLAPVTPVPGEPHLPDMPGIRGSISFEGVGLTLGGTVVLRDIDLCIREGQTVAVVGPSGGGKTTLVSLLLRFHDPTSGTIRVDGQDITAVKSSSLRAQIGYVPQRPAVFAATVSENISVGRPGASESDIVRAARAACAHSFIEALPMGYDTVIGERGITLSPGQRQRISIARAILKDPRILILDEATSSLDPESEWLVSSAILTLMRGRTVIVVAHRLATVRSADLIVVVDRGQVVESGNHDQLMAHRGVYARLYNASVSRGQPINSKFMPAV